MKNPKINAIIKLETKVVSDEKVRATKQVEGDRDDLAVLLITSFIEIPGFFELMDEVVKSFKEKKEGYKNIYKELNAKPIN